VKGVFFFPVMRAHSKEAGLLAAVRNSLAPEKISWIANESRFVLTFETPNSLLSDGTKVYVARRS
jgi:hypothetical protein